MVFGASFVGTAPLLVVPIVPRFAAVWPCASASPRRKKRRDIEGGAEGQGRERLRLHPAVYLSVELIVGLAVLALTILAMLIAGYGAESEVGVVLLLEILICVCHVAAVLYAIGDVHRLRREQRGKRASLRASGEDGGGGGGHGPRTGNGNGNGRGLQGWVELEGRGTGGAGGGLGGNGDGL